MPARYAGRGATMSTDRKKIEDRLRESASRLAREEPRPEPTPPALRLEQGGRKARVLGERRPDETGMLRMLPLTDAAPVEDVGATEFFRVPGPKGGRAAPAVHRAALPPPQPIRPQPRAPAPLGPLPLAAVNHPPLGQVDAARRMPVNEPAPPDGLRIQSARVLAALSLVFLLMSGAALLAAVVLVAGPRPAPAPSAQPAPPPPAVAIAWQTNGEPDDTAAPDGEEATVAAVAPHATAPTGKVREPRVTKTPSARTVTARFTGTALPTRVEVACPGADRLRVDVVGGVATVPALPAGVECWMHPKGGGVVTTAAKVVAGRDYTCTLTSTTTSCR